MTPRTDQSSRTWRPENRLQTAVAFLFGVLALDIIGVAPVLLGALHDGGRLTAPEIGEVAMAELVVMGVANALAGALLPARRLRWIGGMCCLALGALDAVSSRFTGPGVVAVRALAGAPEGILIWITVGLIARTDLPARWAGVYFTLQTLAQLGLAALFWGLVLPRYGPDGGFRILAVTSFLGLPAAVFGPSAFAPLARGEHPSGAPPLKGWLALAACFFIVAGNGAVSIYLQPLASEAGLSADVARLANVVSLVAQVFGGALATGLAGRVSYVAVFSAASVGFLGVWFLYGLHVGAPIFIAATGLTGLLALLIGPFLTPMMIEADPSRRTAVQSAGAQILGGAAGPLAAAFLVSDREVRGVLPLASISLVGGLVLTLIVRASRARG